jgi:hypothetical protein
LIVRDGDMRGNAFTVAKYGLAVGCLPLLTLLIAPPPSPSARYRVAHEERRQTLGHAAQVARASLPADASSTSDRSERSDPLPNITQTVVCNDLFVLINPHIVRPSLDESRSEPRQIETTPGGPDPALAAHEDENDLLLLIRDVEAVLRGRLPVRGSEPADSCSPASCSPAALPPGLSSAVSASEPLTPPSQTPF